MTDKFIQAWCEEHGFSSKVGAIIAYKEIEEKDLNIDNYSEYLDEITVNDESYTVYDESDTYDMIKDEEDSIQDEIKNLIHHYLAGYTNIIDYIDFKDYFNDNGVDILNVIDEDRFEEFYFNGHYFYICDKY